MAVRTRIPIDRTFDSKQKDAIDAVERLQKERYSNPVYEIGIITQLLARVDDPRQVTDVKRKIIVQPYSFDKAKKIGTDPSDPQSAYNEGHEDTTSYIIGLRKNSDLDYILKIGDIIEIEIVNNEITKRNNLDGFYVSTLQENDGFWETIEGNLFPLVDTFKTLKNDLQKSFRTPEEQDVSQITEEMLNTKREVPSYKRGRFQGNIEVITLEGKPVEINTANAYIKMKEAAKQENVYLRIRSGYRSMEEQISIYNSRYEPDFTNVGGCKTGTKVSSKGVSAYPGCSNHQNGKALDIVNTEQNVMWLMRNAQSFGFTNTVKSENWHWEYIG